MKILVTNDDGTGMKGIMEISRYLRKWGDVWAIAPAGPQSGKSASITLGEMMKFKELYREEAQDGLGSITESVFDGTPVDCVKFGVNRWFSPYNPPDLLVSGINHGSNAAIASIYSGTLGAAMEGTAYGIPSIGFSIDTHDLQADMSGVIKAADVILRNYFANPPARGIYLNVNVPAIPADRIKGIRMASQGHGRWIREFVPYVDPRGGEFYLMCGEYEDLCEGPEEDYRLLQEGYVSIVPHRLDNTDYSEKDRLGGKWNLQI